LLALALPSTADGEAAAAIGACAEDAASLSVLASLHGLLPRLAGVSRRAGLDDRWPDDIGRALRRTRRASEHRDLLHTALIAKLIDAFATPGVDWLLLKGQGLAARLYVDPVDRISSDVDILIRREQFDSAERVLGSLGFVPYRKDRFLRAHFHVPFVPENGDTTRLIEVHWDLTRPGSDLRFRLDDWWRGARPLRLPSGPNVRIPPSREEALYVACHAIARGTPTLRDLAEAATLARDQVGRGGMGGDPDDPIDRCAAAALEIASAAWPASYPNPLPAPRGVRAWVGRHLRDPDTVIRVGARSWWPFRRIFAWSLGIMDGLDLFRPATDFGPDADPAARSTNGPPPVPWRAKPIAVTALALALCCAPASLFRRLSPNPRVGGERDQHPKIF